MSLRQSCWPVAAGLLALAVFGAAGCGGGGGGHVSVAGILSNGAQSFEAASEATDIYGAYNRYVYVPTTSKPLYLPPRPGKQAQKIALPLQQSGSWYDEDEQVTWYWTVNADGSGFAVARDASDTQVGLITWTALVLVGNTETRAFDYQLRNDSSYSVETYDVVTLLYHFAEVGQYQIKDPVTGTPVTYTYTGSIDIDAAGDEIGVYQGTGSDQTSFTFTWAFDVLNGVVTISETYTDPSGTVSLTLTAYSDGTGQLVWTTQGYYIVLNFAANGNGTGEVRQGSETGAHVAYLSYNDTTGILTITYPDGATETMNMWG